MADLEVAYSFDEPGNLVIDHSGNGHDFDRTAGGATTALVSGNTNTGLALNGSTGPTVTNTPFGLAAAEWTVMAWVQDTGDSGPFWIIQWYNVAGDTGIRGLIKLAGNITVRARNAGGAVGAGVSYPSDNQWHHFAGSYDGTQLQFFLDGEPAGDPQTLTAPLRTDADSLLLLTDAATTVTIDDIRVYNIVMDQFQITDAMNTPVTDEPAIDSTPYRIFVSDAWVSTAAKVFNGTDWVDAG
jgi:hypothetical protein